MELIWRFLINFRACVFILCNMLHDHSFPFSKLISALNQWRWKILKSTLLGGCFHFKRPWFQEKYNFEVYDKYSSSKIEWLLLKLSLLYNYRFIMMVVLLKTIHSKAWMFKVFPCKKKTGMILGLLSKQYEESNSETEFHKFASRFQCWCWVGSRGWELDGAAEREECCY